MFSEGCATQLFTVCTLSRTNTENRKHPKSVGHTQSKPNNFMRAYLFVIPSSCTFSPIAAQGNFPLPPTTAASSVLFLLILVCLHWRLVLWQAYWNWQCDLYSSTTCLGTSIPSGMAGGEKLPGNNRDCVSHFKGCNRRAAGEPLPGYPHYTSHCVWWCAVLFCTCTVHISASRMQYW